ncbi:unnamed protein product, partial [Mesorhabditis spiculigera]
MDAHEYYNATTLHQELDGMWLNASFFPEAQQTLSYDPLLPGTTAHHTTIYPHLSLSADIYAPTIPQPPLFFQSTQICPPASSTQPPYEGNLPGQEYRSLPEAKVLIPDSTGYGVPTLTTGQPCTSLQSPNCFATLAGEQEAAGYPLLPFISAEMPTLGAALYDSCSPTSSSASSGASVQSSRSECSTSSIEVKPVTARVTRKRTIGRNQLGRAFSPGIPLNLSERQFIVRLYQEGWRICDISRRLAVTHSCVSKILQRYRKTGSVKPKDAKEGRPEGPLVTAIRDYQKRLGIYSQTEIRAQLLRDGLCSRETLPSRSSINHILRTKFDIRKRRSGVRMVVAEV